MPTVVLRSWRALRRLLWEPDEMGLAHAYASGDLDVDGDLAEGLAAMWALVRSGTVTLRRSGVGELPGPAARALRLGRDVIAHHDDTGNASSTRCCSSRWPTRRRCPS